MAKSARKKTGGDSSATVVDIPHEEVHHSEAAQEKNKGTLATVVTIDQQIKNEIAKFSVADSAIAQMKEQYGGLVITGPDDKAGYKAVKEAWGITRTVRTGLEKKGKELRADYGVITKAISAEEKRLTELVEPLEDDLYKKWKDIDDEKERVKKEAEEKEQAQLMARVEEIQSLGMTFSDGFYQIGGTISVDVASLRQFNPEQYEKLKGAITAKKAELDKAEADRKEQQRLADEQRQREAEELKRQQDELKKQQDELRKQQEELENQKRESARMKMELRTSKLEALGMSKLGNYGIRFDNGFDGFTEQVADIMEMNDETFTAFLTTTSDHIKDIQNRKAQHDEQVRKEQEEKERREKFISESLNAVGMVYDYGGKLFRWNSAEVDPIEATWNDFAGLNDAAIATKTHQLGDMITAAKKQEAQILADRKKEQEKAEKLAMGDKERYQQEHKAISDAALKMVPGEFKTKRYQQRAQQFLERLTNLLNEFE